MEKMTEEERIEYLEELEIFKIQINEDVSFDVNKLNTLKEIVSYYPTILYPTPHYVYDQY